MSRIVQELAVGSAPTLDPAGAPTRAPALRSPSQRGRRLRSRASAPRRTRSRLLAWCRRHALSLLVASAPLALAGLVLGTGIEHYPAFSDDEGTYVAQAWAARTQGALGHYTYWYDHPPLGWLQLGLGTWLLGPLLSEGTAVTEGRSLMLIPALASCALLYVLCRRLGLRRPFAVAAVLLFGLSPLAVSMLRMVYLDNIATPWVLAAFVLAASPGRRLWAYGGAGLCFAVAVLTKETSLLILPGLVWQVMQTLDRRTRAFCLAAFGSGLALIALAYPLFALLKGELLPGPGHVSLLEAVEFQLYGRASTGSALDSGSQSHELVASWLSTDAWLLGLGLLLAPAVLLVPRLRPVAVTLLVLVVVGLRPGYLPQPFVIALLPFCALVIAGLADAAWGRGPPRGRRPAVGAAALVVLATLVPGWAAADRYAMHEDQTRPLLAAERWVERNVHPRARLLVDDTLYVDLVEAGFAPRFGVVWFYKLDFTTNLDPSIARNLPQGWRAFDYVVSTRVIRSALEQNPTGLTEVRRALRRSRVVATFGTGADRVEVRRIAGIGTGSGLIPRPQASPDRPSGKAPASKRGPRRGDAAERGRRSRSARRRGRERAYRGARARSGRREARVGRGRGQRARRPGRARSRR